MLDSMARAQPNFVWGQPAGQGLCFTSKHSHSRHLHWEEVCSSQSTATGASFVAACSHRCGHLMLSHREKHMWAPTYAYLMPLAVAHPPNAAVWKDHSCHAAAQNMPLQPLRRQPRHTSSSLWELTAQPDCSGQGNSPANANISCHTLPHCDIPRTLVEASNYHSTCCIAHKPPSCRVSVSALPHSRPAGATLLPWSSPASQQTCWGDTAALVQPYLTADLLGRHC